MLVIFSTMTVCAKKPIKIGVICTLNGGFSVTGEEAWGGIQTARDIQNLVTAILVPIGINPIYLAAIFCFTCIIGMVTPPVGIVLYAAMSVVGTKMSDMFFETFKFLSPTLLVLLIIIFLLV